MKKSIKEHESINLHIKRFGFLKGLICLPFNLLFAIILFVPVFLKAHIAWYDGKSPDNHSNFICFLYDI